MLKVVIKLATLLHQDKHAEARAVMSKLHEALEIAVRRMFLGLGMVLHAAAVRTAGGGNGDTANTGQHFVLATALRMILIHRVAPVGRMDTPAVLRLW